MVIAMRKEQRVTITVSDVEVEVIYKQVKNIRIKVAAPSGSVSVSAPFGTPLATIEELLSSRIDWIKRKQYAVTHSTMSEADRATPDDCQQWKEIVSACVPPLVKAWEPILGVKVKTIAYRNMKSRWGSCQPSTGRVCINTRLALYPPECLEFVIVHEMCHLLVPHHGKDFKELLTRVMPDWKQRQAKLRL